jgi:hypothetical protein
VTPEAPYASPSAFRQALTDKLRTLAATSQWSLEQLQRQMAYDRLLERLYLTDDNWIVKGATALLARHLSVRASIDIDLYRNASRAEAEADLRKAAQREIGDWFRFEVGGTLPGTHPAGGARIPVTAFIGATPWAAFHVDLAGDELTMTGVPDDVPPLAQVALPDFSQRGYRAYPLVDHIADKIVAMMQHYGAMRVPSTRYKDLVDLVAIVTAATVAAEPQIAALKSEAARRKVKLPRRFDVPDLALWDAGYAAEAGRSLLPIARTLDEAVEVVRPFVDPVLDGAASGNWVPTAGRWVPETAA